MDSKKNKSIWGTIAGVGAIAFAKFKWLFVILKLAKFTTMISIVISLVSYGLVYGWKFGAMLVYLLIVHEAGHYIACKIKGIPVKPTLFIPFIGAAVRMKEMPKSAVELAYIAYMGPLFGVISVIPALVLYIYTKDSFWIYTVSMGTLLNVFNCIPFGIFDGGKIVGAIHTKLWSLGLVVLLGYVIVHPSVFLILILILGVIHMVSHYFEQKKTSAHLQNLDYVEGLYARLEQLEDNPHLFKAQLWQASSQIEDENLFIYITTREEKMNELYSQDTEEAKIQMQSLMEEIMGECSNWIKDETSRLALVKSYHDIPLKTRIVILVAYVILVIILIWGFEQSQSILENLPDYNRTNY